jgi:UDP-N-acetylglucosamine 4,6-dehydratase (inverting)
MPFCPALQTISACAILRGSADLENSNVGGKETMLKDKTILITGGTGSFGKCFTKYVLTHYEPKKIIIYSRDEFKQWMMAGEFKGYEEKLRFFIGDVRDVNRLRRACEGVDYIVHAAALKQVPACEYNPNEAIKTNIHGAMNVIDAALDSGVRRVVALSTDKAVNPVNLYGGTKLVSDKLFVAANAYAGVKDINFSIVRYGNVAGSRGSVIPLFHKLIQEGVEELPITDLRMTRFWISLTQGVELVIKALEEAVGGETFISKIPSFKITDLAEAMLPGCKIRETGIRPGEKLHEIMVTTEDSMTTYEYDKHFIVYPQMTWNDRQQPNLSGQKVSEGFSYTSANNTDWLSVEDIRELLKDVALEA